MSIETALLRGEQRRNCTTHTSKLNTFECFQLHMGRLEGAWSKICGTKNMMTSDAWITKVKGQAGFGLCFTGSVSY